MFNLIRLSMELGKLDERVKALEQAREEENRAAGRENPVEKTAEDLAGKRLQDGIDSILGYQWPPRKEDDR